MSRFDCTVATISTQRPLGSGVDMCVQRERVAASEAMRVLARFDARRDAKRAAQRFLYGDGALT